MKKILLPIIFLFIGVLNTQSQNSDTENCAKKLIESIEFHSSVLLNQIFLNIDIMNNNSDVEENFELFDNVLFILEKQLKNHSEYLTTFNKYKLFKKEDFELIFKIKEINFQILEDIKYFRKFINKGDDESYRVFFEKHSEVFKKMNNLFKSTINRGN